MSLTKNKTLIVASVLIIAAILLVIFIPKNTVTAPEKKDIKIEQIDTSAYIKEAGEQKKEYTFIAEQDGQTVLDLISRKVKVTSKKFDFGVIIEAVNALKADKNNFWGIYINDEFADGHPDAIKLKKGDSVKLLFQKTENIKGI